MKLPLPVLILAALAVAGATSQAAPTVWTGPALSFSKASGANPTLPANQDHLTASVAFTRGSSQGLYNILQEASFTSTSPTGTVWATDINNPGDTIDAANWTALDFANWVPAFGNAVGTNFNRPAVVHLISDDIYLNLRFTAWSGGSGGAFSYQRSTPVPESAAAALMALGALGLLAGRPSRRNA